MANQRLVIDNFLGGLAPSKYIGNQTMSDPENTKGFDPTVEGEENVLQRGAGTITLTNASVFQGPVYAMKTISASSGPKLYALGDNAATTGTDLNMVDLLTDTVSASSPWPHPTAGIGGNTIGLEVYNGYLYYATGRYLGRYNFSLTFEDSFNISLNASAYGTPINHPMVQGNGKLFIGNSITGNGGCVTTVSGDTVNLVALDISKTAKIIRALEFNSNYLYIAASQNYNETNVVCESSLYVWDTVSSSWQQEFKFPENDLRSLRVANGTLYCWGNSGFYRFTGSNFELIRNINGGPAAYGSDVTPRGLIIWKSGADIYQYGTTNPGINPIVSKPINDASIYANVALKSVTKSKLYLGGNTTAPFMRVFSSDGTGRAANGEWRSPLFNTGNKIRIKKLYVYAQPLPTNCAVSFAFIDDSGKTISAGGWSTAAETVYTYSPNGAVFETFQLRMIHNANTPSIKLRKIVIEYMNEKE